MMTEKVWTLAQEEELRRASERLNELKNRHKESTQKIQAALEVFIDKEVPSHSLSLAGMVEFIRSNRWELVEILTEGEYSTLIAQRQLHVEKRGKAQ